MADDKKLAVAFAGPGDSSDANTSKLLNDALPEELENIYLPDRIVRAQKGLKSVVRWLEEEIGPEGKGYTTISKSAMVQNLVKDAVDTEVDTWLIYLPPDGDLTSEDEELITEALENGVVVKNLSEGLDDILLEEPEPVAEEHTPRTRGKSRGTARSVPEDDPELALGKDQDEAEATEEVARAITIGDPSPLYTAMTTLYEAFRDQLVREGYVTAPKPEIYPAWCDEDGNYRPRAGRGRGRKGEKMVDLTIEEVRKIEGLEEAFRDVREEA